jgi:hypothetical protein
MNTYNFELEASVNEGDIDLIKTGNKVTLFSDNEDKSWEGTVIRISDVLDPATQTVKIYIRVTGEDLREGMYLSGTVKGKALNNAFEVSRNLLIDQKKLYVVQDSALKLIDIKPLHLTSSQVIVSGLPDNSLLMNETLIGAYEGLKVGTYTE